MRISPGVHTNQPRLEAKPRVSPYPLDYGALCSEDEDRVNHIIEEALARPPGERTNYVKRVCHNNTQLQHRIFCLIDRCSTPAHPDFLQPLQHIRPITDLLYERFKK